MLIKIKVLKIELVLLKRFDTFLMTYSVIDERQNEIKLLLLSPCISSSNKASSLIGV